MSAAQFLEEVPLWLWLLVRVSLGAALIGCGVFLVVRAFRIKQPVTRHALWLAVVVSFLALPTLALVLPPYELKVLPLPPEAEPLPVPQATWEPAILAPTSPSPAAEVLPVEAEPVVTSAPEEPWLVTHWRAVALAVYLAGAGALLGRLLVSALGMRRWLARATVFEDERTLTLLKTVARQLGLAQLPRLLTSHDADVPFATGVLRPTVVLPKGYQRRQTPDHVRAALIHEMAHVKRRDCLWHVLGHLVKAIYFFHPVAWYAHAQAASEREHICDDYVLSLTPSRAGYAEHLLELATSARRRLRAVALGIPMARSSHVEDRIKAILDSTRSLRLKLGKKLGALIVLAVAGALLLAGSLRLATREAMAEEPAAQEDRTPEQEEIEGLLEAVRRAQRPTENMQVTWRYETITPTGGFRAEPGDPLPDRLPYTTRERVATISGQRSRLDTRQQMRHDREDAEPYWEAEFAVAFDGEKERKLRRLLKGDGTELVGWHYLRDKNAGLLRSVLDGNVLPLEDEARMSHWTISLEPPDGSGIYVLRAESHYEGRSPEGYRLTIDGNRGFHIIRTESLRPDGTLYYEVNVQLAQYEGGRWFPSRRERVDYDSDGSEGYVDHVVTITDVAFDIDIPEGTFEVEFPLGTKVWDGAREEWFIVGEQGTASGDSESDLQTSPQAGADEAPKASADALVKARLLDELFGKAEDMFVAKRYDDAEKAVRAILELDPGNAEAQAYLEVIARARPRQEFLGGPKAGAEERVLRERLKRSVTKKFTNTPLEHVVEYLRVAGDVNIVIDRRVLGSDLRKYRVTASLNEVPLEDALDFITTRLFDLEWTVRRGAVFISDAASIQERMQADRDQALQARRKAPSQMTPEERMVYDRLQRPVTFSFVQTPLEDALEFLRAVSDINIVMDRQRVSTDVVVTLSLRDVKLEHALDFITDLLDLKWTIRRGVVFISDAVGVQGEAFMRVYDVRDLLGIEPDLFSNLEPEGDGDRRRLALDEAGLKSEHQRGEDLTKLIKESVAPKTWERRNSITYREGNLIIVQAEEVHAEIQQLLEGMRQSQLFSLRPVAEPKKSYAEKLVDVRTGKEVWLSTWCVVSAASLVPKAEVEVRQQPGQPPTIELELTADAAQRFAGWTKAHVREQMAVVCDGELWSVATVAEAITGPKLLVAAPDAERAQRFAQKLQHYFRSRLEDEKPSTPDEGSGLIERQYDLTGIEALVASKDEPGKQPAVELLKTFIGGPVWERGRIEQQGATLVVVNTADVHQQVANILEGLKKHKDLSVVHDLRFLVADPAWHQEAPALSALLRPLPGAALGTMVAQVGPDQRDAMAAVGRLKKDGTTLSAPRATVLNGRQASVRIVVQALRPRAESGESEVVQIAAPAAELRPVVLGDMKTVKLWLSMDVHLAAAVMGADGVVERAPTGRRFVETVLSLEDGGTFVLSLPRYTESGPENVRPRHFVLVGDVRVVRLKEAPADTVRVLQLGGPKEPGEGKPSEPDEGPELIERRYDLTGLEFPKNERGKQLAVELVKTFIGGPVWQRGRIEQEGMTLTVVNTEDVHGQVADMLEGLKKHKDLTVVLELTVMTADPAWREEFPTLAPGRFVRPSKTGAELALLRPEDPAGPEQLPTVSDLEELKSWEGARTLFAPKVASFNGQRSQVKMVKSRNVLLPPAREGEEPQMVTVDTGLLLDMRPIVVDLPAGKGIWVRLKADYTTVGKQEVTWPDRSAQKVPVGLKVNSVDTLGAVLDGWGFRLSLGLLPEGELGTDEGAQRELLIFGTVKVEHLKQASPEDIPVLQRTGSGEI